eukprot:3961058-Prymnesium_polylepis.1
MSTHCGLSIPGAFHGTLGVPPAIMHCRNTRVPRAGGAGLVNEADATSESKSALAAISPLQRIAAMRNHVAYELVGMVRLTDSILLTASRGASHAV